MRMRPRGTGGRIPKSLTPKQRLARTLRTQQGHATDKKRKGPVEPPDFRSTHAAVRSNRPVASDNSRCEDSARGRPNGNSSA